MRIGQYIASFITCLILLVACGQAEVVPTPIVAPESTVDQPATTATAPEVATTLPLPPTLASAPTSTSTVEPTAVSQDDGILLLNPADFGNNRNPLTGELVADPLILQRRPIAIKLSNSPPIYTRPQSGLNDADLVFEHTTEGAITRFTALFYGKTPPRVGPIRSARLIDLELPAMYDAALAYSGSSAGVAQRLNNSDFRSRILGASERGYYRTGEDKPFEHTLYGRPEEFWQVLEEKGLNTPPNFPTHMAFSSQPPAGGLSGEMVGINYIWTLVEWRYDPDIGRYRRWSDGEAHNDGNTNEQVTAANIIIIFPNHVEDPTICEEIRNGVCAHLSVQIQLWGSGSAMIFRNGQYYEVTWQRVNRNDMLTFTDSTGNPFPLEIGNSWVQVVPNWLSQPVTVEGG